VLERAGCPESPVALGVTIFLCNGLECDSFAGMGDGEVSCGLGGGSGRGEAFGCGVVDLALLWLAFASGEEDEFFLVAVKSIHVCLELFLVGVSATVVDSNADSSGEMGTQFCASEFLHRETTSITHFACVLASCRTYDGAERLERSGGDAQGLGLSAV
jgi:hypothetical protein